MNNRDFKVIVSAADIHIGNKSISPSEYRYQIYNGFINKVERMTFIDGIVICGDILHYQISLNSEYAKIFTDFISDLVRIAKMHSAFMRIIKGTKSHDLDQLNTLKHYEHRSDIDFKIIDDYYYEEIDGYRYAYIAENYINVEIEEYYKDLFNTDKFDILFMHGTIEQTKFKEQNSENISSAAPIFKLKDLYKISNLVISGHIHTPMTFHNKFFYIGSLLRTCHGEEEDKGWNVIVYTSSKYYRVDQIVNEFTFIYKEISITNDVFENKNIDYLIGYINKYIDNNNVDKLSIKITCIDNEPNKIKVDMFKKYFHKQPNITTSFKVLSEKTYERDEMIKKSRDMKPYMNSKLDLNERIKMWAKLERNTDLTYEQINKFLTDDSFNRKGYKTIV